MGYLVLLSGTKCSAYVLGSDQAWKRLAECRDCKHSNENLGSPLYGQFKWILPLL